MCIRDRYNKVKSAGTANVTKAERKEKTEETPLLYDLTTLQKEANAKHGFTAEQKMCIRDSPRPVADGNFPKMRRAIWSL